MKTLACLLLLLSSSLVKAGHKDSAYFFLIMEDSLTVRSFKNYDRLYLDLKSGNKLDGRFKFINDSQICRVNYFYEPTGDTVHIRNIAAVNGLSHVKSHQKIPGGQKLYLGVGAVILICALTSYVGVAVLIIRELHLTNKYGPGHRLNRFKNIRQVKLDFKIVKQSVYK